jgi:hypothetical protein
MTIPSRSVNTLCPVCGNRIRLGISAVPLPHSLRVQGGIGVCSSVCRRLVLVAIDHFSAAAIDNRVNPICNPPIGRRHSGIAVGTIDSLPR